MRQEPSWSRRAMLALALHGGCALAAPAAPVAEALARAAMPARRAERAVLLGAALAGRRIVAVGERGLIVASDDDGASWRQQPVPVSTTLTAVRFADERHGVAVGHGAVVLATADAGTSWRVLLDGRRAAEIALDAALASLDGRAAADAQRLVADGPDKPLLDLLLTGRDQIVAVGAYGLAFASADGGSQWSSWIGRLDNPRGLHAYAIRRRGDTLLVAGEQGLLLRSADTGASFQRLETPYRGSFFSAEMPAEQELVVAGLRGNAWRSRDSGRSWSALSVPMPASITCSVLLPDGQTLWGNQAGFVMRLQGDGLLPVHAQALPPINGLLALGGQRVLALTLMGAVVLPAPGALT